MFLAVMNAGKLQNRNAGAVQYKCTDYDKDAGHIIIAGLRQIPCRSGRDDGCFCDGGCFCGGDRREAGGSITIESQRCLHCRGCGRCRIRHNDACGDCLIAAGCGNSRFARGQSSEFQRSVVGSGNLNDAVIRNREDCIAALDKERILCK